MPGSCSRCIERDAIDAALDHILHASSDSDFFVDVLSSLRHLLESTEGVFGQLDEDGNLLCWEITPGMSDRNTIHRKTPFVFEKNRWSDTWSRVLDDQEPCFSNAPVTTPDGTSIHGLLGVPIQYRERLVGAIFVGGRESAYDQDDLSRMVRVSRRIGPVMVARIAESKARLAAESAFAIADARKRFLAIMSHEIRSPLNGVLGMVEMISSTNLDAIQREHVEILSQSTGALLSLLNNVLDFAKLEASQVALERIGFNLRALLTECLNAETGRAQERRIHLKLDMPEAISPHVRGDPTRLRQIVGNLLSNAIKFTKDGGVIIRVRKDATTGQTQAEDVVPVTISVCDSGPGIPLDKQEHIFSPYAQADSSTTRRFGGTGLGLSIVNQLVDLMGGRIKVESEPGNGATFAVTIPFQECSNDSASEQESPRLAERVAKGKVALVVDDNSVNRRVAEAFLRTFGVAHFEHAENGIEAVARARSATFDLIVIDIEMPVLDGHDAIASIRSLERSSGQRVPIIALTAHATQEDRDRALAAGADDYLTKPIIREKLREVVMKFCGEPHDPANDPSPSDDQRSRPSQPGRIHFDVTTLRSRLGDDEEIFREIAHLFLDEHRKWLEELEQALSSRNGENTRRAAHKIKGALLNMGADDAAAIAKALEESARNGTDTAALGPTKTALRASLLEMKRTIEEELTKAAG